MVELSARLPQGRLVLLLVGVLLPLCGCRPAAPAVPDEHAGAFTSAVATARTDAVTGLLQGSSAGFAVADRVRPMQFPRDHAVHPGFRTEWWYFTGHLHAEDGRRFGFQYTVFRQALAPPNAARQMSVAGGVSAWRSDTAWLAHLALTDVQRGEHSGHARMARGALGLGGFLADAAVPGAFSIMVDGWRMQRDGDGAFSLLAASAERQRTADRNTATPAVDGDVGLRLHLRQRSGPILHGQQGWSRKGPASASYYYSIPRWQATGEVQTVAGEWVAVQGDAWLDREWSTSALAPEQVGWDWFSLTLDDARELMLFRLRRADGQRDPFDSGTLVTSGVARVLRAHDFSLTPLDYWQDESGRRWPVRWLLSIREPALQLVVQAELPDQLMRVGLVYWEGAVSVDGDAKGHGYLEMTGYAPGRRVRSDENVAPIAADN